MKLKIFAVVMAVIVVAAAVFVYFKKPFSPAIETSNPPAIEETVVPETEE